MTSSPVYQTQTSRPIPQSATERNIQAVTRLEQEALTQRSVGERLGDVVTRLAVKPWFIAGHAIVFGIWMLGNTLGGWGFDRAPFFVLCTVIAIEATFLTLLVLASQQRMLRISDRRAHLNLQVDLLAEQELTLILKMLERVSEHLNLAPVVPHPDSAELKKTTDLEALAGDLARTMEQRETRK